MLSLPGVKEPVGKVNRSSVSSIIRRLFVELWIGISKGSARSRTPDCTYFPNEVPRKCEFNQTLAAKAVECQEVLRNGMTEKSQVTFATVDRQVDRVLLTCCVEVPPPKHNILTAENARLEALIPT